MLILFSKFLPFRPIPSSSFVTETHQGKYTRLLLKHLFEDQPYNVLERPVMDESSSVNVTFGLTLQQIIDVVRLTPTP